MVESGGGARLAQEALPGHRVPTVLARQQLDRHPALETRVAAFIDHAHAAGGDPADDGVGAELAANARIVIGRIAADRLAGGCHLVEQRCGNLVRGSVEKAISLLVGGDQRLELASDRVPVRMDGTGPLHEPGPLLRRQFQRLVEERLEATPAVAIDHAAHAASSETVAAAISPSGRKRLEVDGNSAVPEAAVEAER